ncbi:lipopolysaccharide biosynthesis protein [Psychromonas sp. Urea-02u-13]|uniref:lipopolysaccharide biosynthesis protein n=1 Tax=Psychromonas sp. Urea-02u-13 TaxID=2058326 RepID=UPI000C33FE33|nr:oligosaccharide flippase family protein [Psychromonas sp. Urea-02u-13]PKG37527.1 hypothetical protein CXF74_18410 [Psychromonas sp. Urea-02u-13]
MLKKLLHYAPVQIISAVSVFFLIALQTRFLSLSEYGLLALILVFMEATRSFSAQWINVSLTRFMPSASTSDKKALKGYSFRLLLSLLIPGSLSLSLCLVFSDEFSWVLWGALSLLLISKSCFLYFQELFRLTDNVVKYRYSVLLQAILSIVFTYLLLTFSSSIIMAIVALIASNALACLLSYNAIGRKLEKLPVKDRKAFISYGLPILFSGVLMTLSTRVDRIMVSELLGLSEVGLYAAFSNLLLGIMALVFMVIALPLYPEVVKEVKCKEKLFVAHKKYISLLLLVTVPATVGINLIAPQLIVILLGDNFSGFDIELFYWISFAIFCLNFRGHFLDHGLQFTLKTKALPFISTFLLIISLISAYLLITHYGLIGVGYAFVLTQVIGVFISYKVSTYYGYRYPFPDTFLSTFSATLFMVLVVKLLAPLFVALPLYPTLLCNIFVGSLVYLCVHLAFNTLNCRIYLKKVFQ